MSNSFFRFKQFTIHQDKCAMKVCTDACLFGSLVPTSSGGGGVKRVLDIGTGTGLLSLMFAQKNRDAIIDAVEIDEAAAQQAKENFEASPWKERLHIYHTPIQQFSNVTNKLINQLTNKPINLSKYDLIISNPPFFENDLKSKNVRRNLALHSSELGLDELLNAVVKCLKDEGIFSMLLPYHRTQQCINLAAQQSLFPLKKVLVKQTPEHDYFRSMLWFTKQFVPTEEYEIIIQNEEGKYTNELTELLKDYYLYL